VPVLVTALLSEFSNDTLAAGVFIVASFTDALDGWLGEPADGDGPDFSRRRCEVLL
jgi:hypothetical protein